MDKESKGSSHENQNIQLNTFDFELSKKKGVKEPIQYSKEDFLFSLAMPLLGFLFIKWIAAPWANSYQMGAGVAAFTLCFIVAVLAWFGPRQLRQQREAAIYFAIVLLAGSHFMIYENPLLQRTGLGLLIVLAAYCVLVLGEKRIEKQLGSYLPLDMLGALVQLPFEYFGKLFAILLDGVKKRKNGRSLIMLLLGMLLALPACLYIGLLLKSADAAFEQFWHYIMENFFEDAAITAFQIFISIPVSMYLYGLVYGCRNHAGKAWLSRETAEGLAEKSRFLPFYLVIGVITPILILYLMFFFSQTAYFLSAFSGFLPEGMVYSEYARRGFFELCTVSTINLAFIALLLFFTKESGKRLLSRIYGSLFSLFSVALIAISLSKMLLYIDIYGLTPKRLYTSWFMAFLLVVFLFVIVRLWRPSFNMIKWWAAAAMAMFLVLCYANTDKLIARYNVEGYRAGRLQQLDVYLMDELGAEATPYLIEVLRDESEKNTYRNEVRQILKNKIDNGDREGDWRSLTLSGYRSRQLLMEHRDLILAGP